MKKIFFMLFVFVLSVTNAQFRDELNNKPDIRSGIVKNNSYGSLFGFFNPNNFKMNHAFDLSYTTFGGAGLAMGVYTNSMFYQFTDNLNLQADISIVNSPYNSFDKDFSKRVNGVYLSKMQMNYKPTENMTIMFQYRNIPIGFYSPNYYGGYSPFYRDYFYND